MRKEIDRWNYTNWLNEAQDCRGLVFQSLDLREADEVIASLPQATSADEGCVFLGCHLGPKLAAAVTETHGVVIPQLRAEPYSSFRMDLYSVDELYARFDPAVEGSYRQTMDWQTFITFIKVDADNVPLKPVQYVECGLDEVLARRVHDYSVEDALEEFLAPYKNGKGVVAFMGGHDRRRSDADFKRIASLARELTIDGYLVATGGGPGFMEAANMGAFFAEKSEEELHNAIDSIAVDRVSDTYKDPRWLEAAWNVRRSHMPRDQNKCRSLGVPTWFYGHEPPNVFATHVAKYFANSGREEGLLAIASHGVIFAEGNGGTVQEIFQDACQNYYDNYGFKSPMILFGADYWRPKPLRLDADGYPVYPEKAYPAWPLLQGLAQQKDFTSLVTLTSDPAEVLQKIRAYHAPWEAKG